MANNGTATNSMPPRLSDLDPGHLSPRQKAVYDRIANGPREGVRGPLAIWLRAPGFADKAEALGAYCRFENSLSPRLNELAILVTVAFWQARFAWHRHVPLALKAGLSPAVIESIRLGTAPAFDAKEDEIAHGFLGELLETRAVANETWTKAIEAFGEAGLIDLIGISGYYGLVAMTLNAAAVGADEEGLRLEA